MTMTKLDIKTCPSCGGRIRRVRGNWTGNFKGKEYTVPNLEYYECPDCGERVYDREAMRQIEAHSPAFKRATSHKASKHKTPKTVREATSSKS